MILNVNDFKYCMGHRFNTALKKQNEWSFNEFYSNTQNRKKYSKLLSINCAGWNPKKVYKHINL